MQERRDVVPSRPIHVTRNVMISHW